VAAFPEQDHLNHIKAHELFQAEAAGMGLDEQMLQAAQLNMFTHLVEHHAHAYRLRIEQELGTKLPDTDFNNIEEDVDIELDNAVARAVAAKVAPPPPKQGPEPSEEEQAQQKHQQELKHKDESHQQDLQQSDESHRQNLEQKGADADLHLKIEKNKGDQANKATAASNVLKTAGQAAALKDG